MAKKTLFFDEYCGYSIAATAENGKLTEFSFEKKNCESIIGNIYKGRVENVLPGMNAAFINCGLERNCYLSTEDIYPDAGKYDGQSGEQPAFPALKVGDEIAVQVVKAPIGTKGAKVTACFSFVGTYIIYMPTIPFVGVSRKITDNELRKNLLYTAEALKTDEEGIVFRTAAPYAQRGILETELECLRNIYRGLFTKLETSEVGELIYSAISLPIRIMRDTLSSDIDKIIVGTHRLENLIRMLVTVLPPSSQRPIILYDGGRDMLESYGISEQILALSSPKAMLDNGGYLVIEKTEALTVIDVNTGKFIGEDNLEQTVYYTNLLAANEIARQVKLRNIGGIIVVDFIDMENEAHCKALVTELERALKRDAAKCKVAPMSQFGLVEFTRKRTGGNPLSFMTRPCRHCGTGKVRSPRYCLLGMRATLLGHYADGARQIRIEMNNAIFEELTGWEEFKADLSERLKGAEVYAVPHRSYSEDQINFRLNDKSPLPDNAIKLV